MRAAMERLAGILPDLTREARRLTGGDKARADDLVQTVMVEAMGKLATFPPGANGWVFQLLEWRFLDMLKREEKDPVSLTFEIEDDGGAEYLEGLSPALSGALSSALSGLSGVLRDTVLAVAAEGKSHAEAAAEMNVGVNTIDKRVSRARQQMRVSLQSTTGCNRLSDDYDRAPRAAASFIQPAKNIISRKAVPPSSDDLE